MSGDPPPSSPQAPSQPTPRTFCGYIYTMAAEGRPSQRAPTRFRLRTSATGTATSTPAISRTAARRTASSSTPAAARAPGPGACPSPVEHVSGPRLTAEGGGQAPRPRRAVMKVAIFAIFATCALSAALSLNQLILPQLGLRGRPHGLAEIPGNSPLETCLDDEPQLADIEEAYIDPSPPVPGENLTVSAKGTLKKDVTDGAYVDVLVRYGFITLVNRRYDLCELLPEVDLECPVPAGFLSLTRSVELPDNVPPGEYSVEVKAYTVEDELLTCLTGVVEMDS